MSELEKLLIFKKTVEEGQNKMEMKCPFCRRKFVTDEKMEEIISHCGSQHCFTLYHLISDKKLMDPYSLASRQVKTEQEEDNIQQASDPYFLFSNIKTEDDDEVCMKSVEEIYAIN